MIYGIGIDLIKIGRMKEVVDKWREKFLNRVFTMNEIEYCYEKKDPYLSISVRFAAKEALIKAIGGKASIPLTDIEVINNDMGKPAIKANGKLKQFLEDNNIIHINLSLSHEKDYGMAFVVLEDNS